MAYAFNFVKENYDRLSGNAFNNSSGTYVYFAWAESPFVNSKGVPNNAR